MSNYFEYKNRIAFHPGYYIKELVEDSGLTQEDFAKRLDTTPKNLSCLIRGEQSLSLDIAMKLSRLLGTSVDYWLNLQKSYDSMIAEFKSDKESESEKETLKYLDYAYFKDLFNLPDLSRKKSKQVIAVRESLKVATLNVLRKPDLAVSFRSASDNMTEANIVRANAMVQIGINRTIDANAPKFNKRSFEDAVEYALTLTKQHAKFLPLIYKAFFDAGVVLVVLPNLKGSKINGATKKVGDNIMLMVNDRRLWSDTFWFTLFHEIGHIMDGTFGITLESNCESSADKYASDKLIPPMQYMEFLRKGNFSESHIREFANSIDRDPGIVLGRLQNDKVISFKDVELSNAFRRKYKIIG